MNANTSAPNHHPECQLISGVAPPDEPREEPGATEFGAHQRLGSQRWAREHKEGPTRKDTPMLLSRSSRPSAQGPWPLGELQLNWAFPQHPGPRARTAWGTLKGI